MKQSTQGVLFENRFLETYAGHAILNSPRTAITELIANAWDAGATEVSIQWPDEKSDSKEVSIADNGHGMTRRQFETRWRTLSYNRLKHQGQQVNFPDGITAQPRTAFGRSGVGRFAAFCFGEEYEVRTTRDGEENVYNVLRSADAPFEVSFEGSSKSTGHGTTITIRTQEKPFLRPSAIKSEIGLRFSFDPNFKVQLNGDEINFKHIPQQNIQTIHVDIPDVGQVNIIVLKVKETDRTTHRHGVAWHVNGRLVGECSWQVAGIEEIIDGRRIAAKRYTFIVLADCLAEVVNKDWSGFEENSELFRKVAPRVAEEIIEVLNQHSEDDRRNNIAKAREASRESLKNMGPLRKEIWLSFLNEAQIKCPSITERDLSHLGVVLATLEESHSQYSLIQRLSTLTSQQLDNTDEIFAEWTIDMAKVVLDELKGRFLILKELREKSENPDTLEVQELQPLFDRSLWIFGPEFESIHFTSNEGMTSVIQMLCGDAESKGTRKTQAKGSRRRPDYAILPDGTASFHSCAAYEEDGGGEIGIARLVIIELKRPGVPLGREQKSQAHNYVIELLKKSKIQESTSVTCYVVGQTIKPYEQNYTNEGKTTIWPVTFGTVINRAESRLFHLEKKIAEAPFLKGKEEEIAPFLNSEKATDYDLFSNE